MSLSHSPEIKDKKNLDINGMPSIWLMTDVLMFGDIVQLLSLMSVNNLNKISKYYNCNNDELISWLKCLNFIRNICAHNSNVLDIKINTPPKISENWKNDIYKIKDGNYSNRLAIVIYIIHHFIKQINNRYKIQKIPNSILSIVGDNPQRIQQLGFVNKRSITKLKNLNS
ncbi:Abi family protein [Staphylococcus warneri]|uniref:Abi family protein n=1 Tax=Staphylococcus warneri TaxID=1292 RepID=UPI003261BFD0